MENNNNLEDWTKQALELEDQNENFDAYETLEWMGSKGISATTMSPQEAYEAMNNPQPQKFESTGESDFVQSMRSRLSKEENTPVSDVTTNNLKDKMAEFLKARQDERGQ